MQPKDWNASFLSRWELKRGLYLIGVEGPFFCLLALIVVYSLLYAAGFATSYLYLYYVPLVVVATWYSNRSFRTTAALSSGYAAVSLFLAFGGYAVDPVVLFLFTLLYLWAMAAVTLFGAGSEGTSCSLLQGNPAFFFDPRSLRITSADPALAGLLGLPAHEIQGLPLSSVWEDPADLKSFSELLEKDAVILNYETVFHGPSGRPVPVLLSCVPGMPEYQCSVLAVTSLKSFRDAQAGWEADRRRNFTTTAAHELRTPLQPIFGYLYLLLEDRQKYKLGDDVCRILRICKENLDRERKVVNRLLELSLLEEGGISCEPAPVDLAKVVNEVLSCHGFGDDVSVTLAIPDNTILNVDQDHLFIILESLITNAVRYNTPPKSVRISYAEDGAARYISVKDNGIGIEAGESRKIFEPFYLSNENKMTRTFDRMGLGLCIAERYAHLNGWEIRVDSVPGEGSTFTVILWRGISRCTPGRSRL